MVTVSRRKGAYPRQGYVLANPLLTVGCPEFRLRDRERIVINLKEPGQKKLIIRGP